MIRRRAAPLLLALLAAGCESEPAAREPSAVKSAPLVRAARRAYDGAPPTIPHDNVGANCSVCHNAAGVAVAGLGFAPPSPHESTGGMSATSRCQQCHVPTLTNELFADNRFVGLPQDLRRGRRLNDVAPPVMPHQILMRENCAACHTGPAAREAIRCSHPERVRCRQCHVSSTTTAEFTRSRPGDG